MKKMKGLSEMFELSGNDLIKYTGTNTTLTIPNTIVNIADFAFYGCDQIEEIIIPEGVMTIGNFAFYNCEQLKKITLPTSIKLLGGGIFSCCKSLEKVEIKSSITSIKKSTFYKCAQLKEVILPHTITTIEHSAFSECSSLKFIKLPQDLHYIGENAFLGCESLETLTMPEHLEIIDKKAFYHCFNLKNINISKGLKKIGASALETLSTLTIISNETVTLQPMMFDSNWNLYLKRKDEGHYCLFNSYLPKVEFEKWKPNALIILLVNFLETYDLHSNSSQSLYYSKCQELKEDLLVYLMKQKRYVALNKALDKELFDSNDLVPYFNDVTNREQKAKLMQYKNKENTSLVCSLEDELNNLF